MPSILVSEEGFIVLPNIVFTATLVVFYYAFYRCHVKVWRSSRSFYIQPRIYYSSTQSCHSVVLVRHVLIRHSVVPIPIPISM